MQRDTTDCIFGKDGKLIGPAMVLSVSDDEAAVTQANKILKTDMRPSCGRISAWS